MHFVYLLTNKNTDKIYVGKTSRPVFRRWDEHKSAARFDKNNTRLYNSIKKHGTNYFSIKTLDSVPTSEMATALEKFYIRVLGAYKPERGYNRTFGGDGAAMTNAAKEKLSRTLRERKVRPSIEACRLGAKARASCGYRHSPETIAKISSAQKGRPLTEEHRLNLRVPKTIDYLGHVVRIDIPLDEVARLYESGLSCAAIASRFETTASVIANRLKKSNVSMRPARFPKKKI